MIKHITQSDEDKLQLSNALSRNTIINDQPDNYKGIIVQKPWGCEGEFYSDASIAAWFLSIEKGHSTSMHCHPNKRTVLIVLSGKALGRTLHNSSIINVGDVIIYEPGVFHSTKGVTKIEMAEIESPPIKTDLVRLDDNYGRERMGYEDKKMMKESYNYFYIDEKTPLYSHGGYIIMLTNIIHKNAINVIGHNKSGLEPNQCILEIEQITIPNANVLCFKFPHREKDYEFREYI